MTVTANSIKNKFPEFASQTNAAIEFAIEDAMMHIDATTAGEFYDTVISWATAHFLMLSVTRAAITGEPVVKSETVGPITVNYETGAAASAVASSDPSDWSSTPYGMRYLQLMSALNPPIFVI